MHAIAGLIIRPKPNTKSMANCQDRSLCLKRLNLLIRRNAQIDSKIMQSSDGRGLLQMHWKYA